MTAPTNTSEKLSIIGRFFGLFARPVEEDDGRHRGIVKYTIDHKAYGFIHAPDLRSDLYFHFMDTSGPDLPRRGDQVSFEPIFGAQGYRARLVEVESKKESERHAKCSSCGKLMVPRLITHRGVPDTSVCPFCWTTFKDSSPSLFGILLDIGLIILILAALNRCGPDQADTSTATEIHSSIDTSKNAGEDRAATITSQASLSQEGR